MRHIMNWLGICRLPSVMWVILWALAIMSQADIIADQYRRDLPIIMMCGEVTFAAFKATLLCILWYISKRVSPKWLSITLQCATGILIALFGFLAIINVVSLTVYGFGISRKLAVIILQTNANEAIEFLPGLATELFSLLCRPSVIATILGTALLAYFVRKIPSPVFNLIVATLSLCGCAYIIYYRATSSWGTTAHLVTVRTTAAFKDVIISELNLQRYLAAMPPLKDAATISSDFKARNIILIIGESASREHLSLYGYPLPTSPYAEAIRDSLFIFTDAIASSTLTADNIPRLVTFMADRDTVQPWYEYPSIIDVFNHAGYTTAWISNQERGGIWSNVSTALAMQADTVTYIGKESSEDHLLTKYDEELLPHLQDFISSSSDRPHFAIVHLMGSHRDYSRRYPPNRAKFTLSDENSRPGYRQLSDKQAHIVAEYDNSILYSDSVLHQIILQIESDTVPGVVIYVSDHGEHLYERGDFAGRDGQSITVPLIIYANSAYRHRYPDIIKNIKQAIDKPVSTSMLTHSLLTLSGTNYSAYDSAEDIINPGFKQRIRYSHGVPETIIFKDYGNSK